MLLKRYDAVDGMDRGWVTLESEQETYIVSATYKDYYDDMYGDAIPFVNNDWYEFSELENAIAKFETEKRFIRYWVEKRGL